MAIQRSGPIKFSEIATEFPDADQDNQAGNVLIRASEYYRGLTSNYVHSGTAGIPEDTTYGDTSDNPPISLSDFYNTSASEYLNYYIDESNPIENGLSLDFSDKTTGVSVIVVIGDTNNTDCLDFLDNLYDDNINGWQAEGFIRGRDSSTQASNVTGIGSVSSINPSKPAITITNVPADSFIWIRNFGFVVGAGGNGGAKNTGNTSQSAQNGGTGGDGIYVANVDSTSDVLIENWGSIAGGAGGGGAGGQGGLAESTYQTYAPITNYYDSTSHTGSLSSISNANILFHIEETNTTIDYRSITSNGVTTNEGRYKDDVYTYKFWLTKIDGNQYSYNYYLYGTSLGSWSAWYTTNNPIWSYVTAGWKLKYKAANMVGSSYTQAQFDTYNMTISPETIIGGSETIDGVTFLYTSPGVDDFTLLTGTNSFPFAAAEFQYIKNATTSSGVAFSSVVGGTYADTYTFSVPDGTWTYKKAFKTLASNITTNISHGGEGAQGANFVNYDSTSTTTFASSTGSTVSDTLGITTTPNAIYHPAFKYGQGGQGGSGDYWSVTQGDAASLTLETTTVTATSGENGTGTNGSVGGSQGGLGTAINTSLSNVTITNY